MEINIQNYEEYAIDYLEGNLSAEGEEAMQFFLLQYPAIEAEMMGLEEDLEAVTLEENSMLVFADKELLFQLEEEKKGVPLYVVGHNWRKYVLPIAAVLCVFLVWQAFFQPMGGVSEHKGEWIVGQETIEKPNDLELKEIEAVESLAIDGKNDGSVKSKLSKNRGASMNRWENEDSKKTDSQKITSKTNVTGWSENQVKKEEVAALGVEIKKRMISEDSDKRRGVAALAILPTQSHEIIAQNIAIGVGLRGLEQSPLPPMPPKKQSSNFMKNLKKVLLPEVWVKNTENEVEEDGGSDVLVSISVTPEQHNFIKKIFKNNK